MRTPIKSPEGPPSNLAHRIPFKRSHGDLFRDPNHDFVRRVTSWHWPTNIAAARAVDREFAYKFRIKVWQKNEDLGFFKPLWRIVVASGGGSLLIKKETLNRINLYNEKFKFAQDYKLFYDLINANYKIKTIKEPLYYLNTENNISTLKLNEQQYYADCVRKNILP